MKPETVQELVEAFAKLSKGEQKRAMALFAAAMEPEENIVPPPLPETPGGPPVGPKP